MIAAGTLIVAGERADLSRRSGSSLERPMAVAIGEQEAAEQLGIGWIALGACGAGTSAVALDRLWATEGTAGKGRRRSRERRPAGVGAG